MTGGAAAGAVRDRRDLYSMLGVAPDATTEEIAAAFRARAKEMHPDRTPGDEAAAEDFKALSRAYATLRAPRSRAAYDARRFAASTSTRTPNRTSTSAADVEPRTPILSTIAHRARAESRASSSGSRSLPCSSRSRPAPTPWAATSPCGWSSPSS